MDARVKPAHDQSMWGSDVTFKLNKGSVRLAATLTLLASIAFASPAFADACDDLAAQLKGHIDGLAIGKTAANVIYLSHPSATDLRLGCATRQVINEVLATPAVRKPKPKFLNLVAKASAVIFTVPVD